MKINKNYFMKTDDFGITDGYFNEDYYIVIVFKKLYKEFEFENVFNKYGNIINNFNFIFNIDYMGEEKTIVVKKIKN